MQHWPRRSPSFPQQVVPLLPALSLAQRPSPRGARRVRACGAICSGPTPTHPTPAPPAALGLGRRERLRYRDALRGVGKEPQAPASGSSLRRDRDVPCRGSPLPLQTQPPPSPTTLRPELYTQPTLLRSPSDPPLSTALLSSPALLPALTSSPQTLLMGACWKRGHLRPIYGGHREGRQADEGLRRGESHVSRTGDGGQRAGKWRN